MNGKTMEQLPVFCLTLIFLILQPVQAVEPVWTYSSQGSEISGVTVSSDGSIIAVGAGNIWLLSPSGELLCRESYGEQVVFTPDGSSLISSYLTMIYHFRRNASLPISQSPLMKIWEISMINNVRSVDISDDGKTVVVSISGKGTYMYSSQGKLTGGDDQSKGIVRVSAKGEQIAGVSQDGLCLYSSQIKKGKCSLVKNVTIISQPDFMEITSNGDNVVFNDDQKIVSVSTRNQEVRWTLKASGDVTSLAMTPSGSKILVGTENGNIDLVDTDGHLSWSKGLYSMTNQSVRVTGVVLSNDGNIAVAGTYEGKIVALNSDGKELWSNQTKDHIRHVAISGDGSLVIATGDKTVYAFSSALPVTPVISIQSTANPLIPQNITTVSGTIVTQRPIRSESVTKEIIPAPTVFSVIRTATQSPLPDIILFLGILVAFILIVPRH